MKCKYLDWLWMHALSQWLMARNPGLVQNSGKTLGSQENTPNALEQVCEHASLKIREMWPCIVNFSIPGGHSPIPIPVADEAFLGQCDQWSPALCQSWYSSCSTATPPQGRRDVLESTSDNGNVNIYSPDIQVGY